MPRPGSDLAEIGDDKARRNLLKFSVDTGKVMKSLDTLILQAIEVDRLATS